MGRPVVAAFHVQPENALLNVGIHAHWASEWIYKFWVQHLYDQVDAVVAPTAFAERKLREHGLTTPVTVISNGVPPDLVALPAEREPAHRGFFLILMVGRLATEKHQEVLLEAVRRSKHCEGIQVVIAGSGPREAELKALAAQLPRGAEIGFLPRDRLMRLFNSADLLVHCSEVELEGISVLEAMSVGLPVLVGQGAESAASDLALGDDFRFPVGDAAALAQRLDALIDRPEVVARARVAYRDAALQFDFDANVAKLVDLYRTVLERAG
jgi:glycosyltransferase involved in cell wall biosynthesis